MAMDAWRALLLAMLRSRYDFSQYLSISGPIERSRRSYYRAFVLSETDDGDLTYSL
jgi:Fic family protein